MTRQISFGGVTTPKPGAYSKVDFSAGAQPSSASVGIVGIVGEADLGTPGELLVFDDDKTMRAYFGSGPLADAARPLFRPSTDPFIPGGASRVYAYKTNNSTQSILPLYAGVAVAEANLTAIADNDDGGKITVTITGAFASFNPTGYTLEITSGTGVGQRRVITEKITDDKVAVGETGSGLEFSPVPTTSSKATVFFTQVVLKSASRGALYNNVEFDLDSLDADSPQDPRKHFRAKVDMQSVLDLDTGSIGDPMFTLQYNGNLAATVVATGTGAALSSAGIIKGAFTVDAFNRLFVRATSAPITGEVRKISTNDATDINVTTPFSASTLGETYSVLSGIIAECDVVSQSGSAVVLDATDNSFADSDLVGLVLVVTTGAGSGQRRVVASNTGNSLVVSEQFNTPLDATSVCQLHYISGAAATVQGTAGVVSELITGVVVNGANGQTLTLATAASAVGSTTLTATGAFALTSGDNFVYVAAGPGAGQFRWLKSVDSANAVTVSPAWSVALSTASAFVVVPAELSMDIGIEETLQEFIGRVNANPTYVALAGSGVNVQRALPSTLDFNTNNHAVSLRDDISNAGLGSKFTYHLQLLITAINNQSSLVVAERSDADGINSGAGLPVFIVDALRFQGATRGVSANSDWQDAFDAMLLERINHVVPAMSDDLSAQGKGSTATIQSVAQMASGHVSTARLDKNERTGFIGFDGSKADLLRLRGAIGNFLCQLVGNGVGLPNAQGDTVSFGAWMSACIAAGMRAGGNDESLTNKSVSVSYITSGTDWNSKNKTDEKDLLLGGILMLQQAPAGGFRWVRDLTCEVSQENTLLNIGATVWNWMQVNYNTRTALENRFTGAKAIPATPAAVKNFLGRALEREEEAQRISRSILADGTSRPAWQIQKVSISADVMRVFYKVAVTGYVDFGLIEASLEIPILESN